MANTTEQMTSAQLLEYLSKGRAMTVAERLQNQPGPTAIQTKYRNQKTPLVIDGEEVTLDSKAEARFYVNLQMRQKSGETFTIERQVPIRVEINGHLVCKMIVDFRLTFPDGRQEWFDVKGAINDASGAWKVFRLKQKLVLALLSIDVKVVSKNQAP